MSFSCPQSSLDEMLSLAKRFGYQGIEPRYGTKHQHGVQETLGGPERAAVRKKIEASGISLACLASSVIFGNPATAADMVAACRRGIALAAAFSALRKWIRHMHLHDGLNSKEGVIKPIGQGDVDHREVLRLCRDAGYRNWLSLEWEGTDPWDVHLPREIAALKRYEKELGMG